MQTLSKSTFVKGCQCEKMLYLNRHQPQLKAEISDQKQAVLDRGTDVGLLAQQLFPDGVDASPETTSNTNRPWASRANSLPPDRL